MRRIFFILFYISVFLLVLNGNTAFAQVINGDFSSGLSGWETSGDVSIFNGIAILQTGGINGPYETALSTDFVIPGDRLNFRYYFDITGTDDVKYPDFKSFGPDFLQVSVDAGTEEYFKDVPLASDPTGGFVPFSLDISSFTPGSMARLTFLLFDEDDEHRSVAAIDDISDPLTPSMPLQEPETLILLGSGLIAVSAYSRYRGIRRTWICVIIISMIQIFSGRTVYAELQETNINDKTTITFTSPVFNTRTNTLTLNMAVTNISDTTVVAPIKVVITGISSPDVTVSNSDGYTPEGLPFFKLDPYVVNNDLTPGEKSQAARISFHNPKKIKFRWDQDVTAFIDVPLDEGPVIYNICLVPGEFPPVCEFSNDNFDIVNPKFDRMLQDPMPEMYLYEQVRVYAFDYNDLPVKVMINGLDAVFNEYSFYYYRNMTLQSGTNTLSIVVTDDAGLEANREITMSIDASPPVINILNGAEGAVVTSPEIVLSGGVDDTDITKVRLIKDFITSEDIPVVNGLFSVNIILTAGHNNLRLEAVDQAGNSGSYNLDITRVLSESGDISGSVYNSAVGIPLSGAAITFTAGDSSGTVLSNEAGHYRIEGIKSGDITLHVDKDGYDPVNLNVFSAGGDSSHVQDIALIPSSSVDTFTLTGQVKDTGQSPLSGAKISVKGTTLSARTDSNGLYVIKGIPRISFIAEASGDLYEEESVNVDIRLFSNVTRVITHNFILNNIPIAVGILSPEDGEYIAGGAVLVTGYFRSGISGAGVIVNGIPATVYNGYFVVNDVPLIEGVNKITAEIITPSGTLLSDSVDAVHLQTDNQGFHIYSQEVGLVPLEVPVIIESFGGSGGDIPFKDYTLNVSGPGAADIVSDGESHYRVFITEPGMYTFTFVAVDSAGNTYKDTFGFAGMTKEVLEPELRQIWVKFKDSMIAGNTEDGLAFFMPDTRIRYREQFSLLGNRIPDIFAGIGDIQLISINDNEAKTRVYEGEIMHHVWFARDIYGQWKIHKF